VRTASSLVYLFVRPFLVAAKDNNCVLQVRSHKVLERIYLPRKIIQYHIENNEIQWQAARGSINSIEAGRLCQLSNQIIIIIIINKLKIAKQANQKIGQQLQCTII